MMPMEIQINIRERYTIRWSSAVRDHIVYNMVLGRALF
jgi:hypothetical protein